MMERRTDFDRRLGEQIARARNDSGMSQETLGRLADLSRVAISQIEAGKRRVSADELQRFSVALEIPADHLVDPLKRPQVVLDQGDVPTTKDTGLRISVPQENVRKFKEVLLYLLTRVGGKPNVGETVLYKLLYFIDFDHYEKHEEQLVGATYVKREFGPLPVEFQTIARAMIDAGELQTCEADYFGKRQKRYLALREPDLSVLDGRELRTIDDVICRLSDMNGARIAEYSHKDVPWLAAAEGEVLDYESVFYRTREYSARPDVA
jgi:transcriptional regulator with XRE-family HTH domain